MFSYTFSAAGFRNQIISAFDGREQQTLKYLFDEELASSSEHVGYREADILWLWVARQERQISLITIFMSEMPEILTESGIGGVIHDLVYRFWRSDG